MLAELDLECSIAATNHLVQHMLGAANAVAEATVHFKRYNDDVALSTPSTTANASLMARMVSWHKTSSQGLKSHWFALPKPFDTSRTNKAAQTYGKDDY